MATATQVTGADILGARAKARLSQRGLARELGLFPGTLVDIENDRLPIGPAGYAAFLEAVKAAIERIQSQ
jgi:DNA-binding XRE family transcriptional regulator